jgi:RNA polymerase sigma-70 factor (ECF subfamily)
VRDALFQQAYPLARRAVQVRAASGAMRPGDREDFEQEALLGLWIALRRYDPSRASLRTFVERLTDNRFASLMRRRRSALVVERLDGHRLATPDGIPAVQFHVDFERILSCLTDGDRAVARLLLDHRPSEVSRMLGIARSTLYGRMARLRRAFLKAGYGPANTGGTR